MSSLIPYSAHALTVVKTGIAFDQSYTYRKASINEEIKSLGPSRHLIPFEMEYYGQ